MDSQTQSIPAARSQSLATESFSWLAGVLLCQCVAYWPSWAWLYRRVVHSAEDGLGMLAVVFLIGTTAAWNLTAQRRICQFSLRPVVALILLYGLSFASPLPSIFQAAIASISVFLTLHLAVFGSRPPLAYWGMIMCALPVVPSLQFYLGYPARLISASLTVPLLRMNGLSVHREGTYLIWQDRMLQFDAPCSGVTMLWAGVLLTFSVAYIHKLTLPKTIQALGVCALFILLGNVLRAGSLFYLEAGLFPAAESWWHDAVGIAVFVTTAVALIATTRRLSP